jgi:aspartokinase-like uncharacterized kinase
LGGSLLNWAEFPNRLRQWLQAHPHPCNLLVVGGGEVIEAIRGINSIFQLDSVRTHWLCIDLLATTAEIAWQLLPEFEFVDTPDKLQAFLGRSPEHPSSSSNAIVAVSSFYGRTLSSSSLPTDWSTTSDSLAALLTTSIGASELILLKSTGVPPHAGTIQAWAESGLVDGAFPVASQDIEQVRIINLRDRS